MEEGFPTAEFPPMPELTACALCSEARPLQESHLIPAFIAQSLRESSGTGHMRTNHTPNRRVQDSEKVRLLCAPCEQLFSGWEREFAERAFRPTLEDPAAVVEFDGWMARFACSVLWRVLRRYQLVGLKREPWAAYEAAEQAWREFLLGARQNVGTYELHLLPVEVPARMPTPGAVRGLDSAPSNLSRYFLTTMGYDLPITDSGIALVYVKIPRFAIFGLVSPGKRSPFVQGTKLPMRKGRIAARAYKLDVRLMNYMYEKARQYSRIMDSLSPTQRAKIDAAKTADPDRMLASESVRAMAGDVALFGHDAFERPRSPESEEQGLSEAGAHPQASAR